MVIDNSFYMQLAIDEAWKYHILTYPNPAVGCCVVGENGEILAVEAHKKAGGPHAEVEALKSAYVKLSGDKKILDIFSSEDIHNYLKQNHNKLFENVKVYTTLEPCSHRGKTPSCADLLSFLGVKKVYIGSKDTNPVASCGEDMLLKAGVETQSGILQRECENLIISFGSWSKGHFVFFKWAQTFNAKVDGGVISSKQSRTVVHKMRGVCDLLVIGGNTVRIDRPTLDARLAEAKAPDILILSKQKEFDLSIPLFGVENRNVFIDDSFDILKKYNNIMIEGGEAMFELSKKFVDIYLCFIAPKFGGEVGFEKTDDKFEILNIQKESQDIMVWMKKEVI